MRMNTRAPYRRIIERYTCLAPRYDRAWRGYLERTFAEALEALHLTGTERVLDVGCGTGELERLALQRFPQLRLVGLDVTPSMITLARRKLAGRSSVQWFLASGEDLPFGDGSFDAVVSCNTLHYVRMPGAFFRECARVLRPHGTLAVVDWCRDFWHGRLIHYWRRLTDRTYVTMYRLEELAQAVGSAGLAARGSRRFVIPPCYGMMWLRAEKSP